MSDLAWQPLIEQLTYGECTPFLGAGACDGVLPNGSDLSRQWADYCDYPFDDQHDLAQVMQYAAFTQASGDVVTIKEQVCRKLKQLPPPDFSVRAEPHAALAAFPLPVFITTNYDDFLARALVGAGKDPQVAICPWAPDDQPEAKRDDALELEGDATRPLVYHLHGNWDRPRSLVLTQRDYLEFLVNVVAAKSSDDEQQLIPAQILTALATRPLLFIGYSLQDWTFLTLFHGLLKNIPGIHRRRHVSVQLPPPVSDRPDSRERAMRYLTHHLDGWNISIYWGTAAQFCAEIQTRMGRAA